MLEQFKEFDLQYHLTESPGHATDLAREAVSNGSHYVLCIGGDGTLNEVVQSLANTDTVLVPVSAGTGSDFVKTLGIKDLESIKEAMFQNRHMNIDLGVAERNGNKRYFINILEVGFGASVMKRVNSRRKRRGGSSFTSSVLALLPFFKPFGVKMSIKGTHRNLDLAEMVVANGKYFGGGMLAAPDAKLNDGLLEIHVVAGVGRMQMISKLGKLRDGSYIKDPTVQSHRTDEVELTGNAPVEMDGEDFGDLPLKISVAEKCLRIISP